MRASVATTFAVDALDIQRVCEESEESESVNKSQEVHRLKYPTLAQIPEVSGSEGGSVSILKSLLDAQSLASELLSPRWSNWSEGCWLQLMCCTLPKCLCP